MSSKCILQVVVLMGFLQLVCNNFGIISGKGILLSGLIHLDHRQDYQEHYEHYPNVPYKEISGLCHRTPQVCYILQ